MFPISYTPLQGTLTFLERPYYKRPIYKLIKN